MLINPAHPTATIRRPHLRSQTVPTLLNACIEPTSITEHIVTEQAINLYTDLGSAQHTTKIGLTTTLLACPIVTTTRSRVAVRWLPPLGAAPERRGGYRPGAHRSVTRHRGGYRRRRRAVHRSLPPALLPRLPHKTQEPPRCSRHPGAPGGRAGGVAS